MYLKGVSILNVEPKDEASYTWQSIMKVVHDLKAGFKFRIGRGHISLWYDTWVDEVPLCTQEDYVNIMDTHLIVEDIYDNGIWRWNRLATIIPNELHNQIESFTIYSLEDDLIIWGENSSRNYSSKSS